MDTVSVENNYIENLKLLEDAGSQCEYLIALGMQYRCREPIREDRYRIGGCKTAIWLKAEGDGELAEFCGDSDSLLVKGVLAILSDIYAGQTSGQIRGHKPKFLDFISDRVIYPEIKNNGVLKCYQKIAALT